MREGTRFPGMVASKSGQFEDPRVGEALDREGDNGTVFFTHVIELDTTTASAVGTGKYLPPDAIIKDIKILVQDPTSNLVNVTVGSAADNDAWSAAQNLNGGRGVFTPGIGSGDRTDTGATSDGGPVEIVTKMSAVASGTTAGKILIFVDYM